MNLTGMITSILLVLTSSIEERTPMQPIEAEKKLFEFETNQSIDSLFITNDTVMGGVSQGRLAWNPGGWLEFTGKVSLENNGGFASFRSKQMDFGLTDQNCLWVHIKGDGKKYRISIGSDQYRNGVYYYYEIETKEDAWMTITAPLEKFVARFRGRVIENAPTLQSENIESVGFMIADSQSGTFSLMVDWVRAGFAMNPKYGSSGN